MAHFLRGFGEIPARVGLVLCALWTCAAGAQPGGAQDIELAAGQLRSTLGAISEAYQVNVMAADDLVAGKVAPRIAGSLTAQQALQKALSPAGLQAKRMPTGAFVVETSPAVPARRGGASSANPEPDEPVKALDEIVVLGEKFERSLQDTISSVAVLEGEVVDASYITDIEQVLQRIPNVSTGGGNSLAIRGIPERGVGSGTGDTAQTSAIYVDGAIQSQSGAAGGLLSTWDVQQVEVFRGAQTTTQGRAALGGAVVVNTVDPSFDWNGRARLAAGEFGTQQYAGAVGGPLIDGVLAFRVAADLTRTDGFTEFQTAAGEVLDDIGQTERDLYRGKLLYTPNEDLRVMLSITQSDSIEGPNTVNGTDFFAGRATEIINVAETDVTSYALNIAYEIDDRLRLTSVTSYTDLTNRLDPVEETIGGAGTGTVLRGADDALTQEFRLNYDGGGAFRGLAGIYYNRFNEASQRTVAGMIGPSSFLLNDGYDNSFDNYALFAEGEIRFSDAWSLVLGARYDVEDSTRQENAEISLDPPLPFLPNSSTNFSGDASFNAFLPKVGVTYNFSDRSSLSFVAQRAYRPGGADIRPDTQEAIEFDPEYTNNYELAYRGLFLDGTLSINANAFYVDYTDMQIRFAPNPQTPVVRFIANAGESELYGLELEALWQATDNLSLYASAGTADSEFGEFLFQGENLEGNEFPFQPNLNASFGGTYRMGSGFSLTVDNIYSSEYFSQVQNGRELETDAYFLTNVRFGYETRRWSAFVYGQNIFDEEYLLSVFRSSDLLGVSTGTLGQPQSFGVVLELTF